MSEPQLTDTHIVLNNLRRREVTTFPIEQVSHFTYGDKYLSAHVDGHGEVLLTASLGDVERQYGDKVVRVHRSAVVFKDRILKVRRDDATTIRLMDVQTATGPVVVAASRHRMTEIRQALAERAT